MWNGALRAMATRAARPLIERRMMTGRKKADTSAKLRDDIDRGKADDKVGFPDPAAAPLGTDAEARGASPTREELRMARRQEVEDRADGPTAASEPRPVSLDEPSTGKQGGRTAILLMVALILLAGLGYAALT